MAVPYLHLLLSSQEFAYAAIFLLALIESIAIIGLAFPGTSLVIFVGYLCSTGKLNLIPALIAVSIGGFLGDVISFYLGRLGLEARGWFSKKIDLSKIKRAENFIEKHGVKGIFLARFIGPLRPIFPLTAGILKMKIKVFLSFDFLSNIVSALFFITLGFYFGRSWKFYVDLITRYEIIFIIFLVLFFLTYLTLTKKPKK